MSDKGSNEINMFEMKHFFPLWCHQNKSGHIENEDSVLYELKHEYLEIKYIYEGSAEYKIEDTSLTVEKGDIVFINPYEHHSTIKLSENGCRYHLMMIGLDFFAEMGFKAVDLRRVFIVDRIKIVNLIRQNQRIIDIFKDIIKEYFDCRQGFQVSITALATELFVLLLRDYTKIEKFDNTARYSKVVEKAIVEISNHFAEKYTLDDLAKLCNVSKFHFCRIFKMETGMTAMQYLMHQRIKNAEIMLVHTNYKISEIAQRCGFDDVSHFSKTFKNYSKISPQKFKEIYTTREDYN